LDISYTHAANAIAAYEASAFRCANSPFDQYLNGDETVLDEVEIAGMDLFYGEAGCVNCHSGKFQTDQDFYAIAMPQIGPGKGDNLPDYSDGRDDFGRERVTGDPVDRFKFRTPSLRQVTLTGPWGHDGAYDDLEAVVRHHLDAVSALEAYKPFEAVLPYRQDLNSLDDVAHLDPVRRAAIAAANELDPIALDDVEVSQLMAFLSALTDYSCLDYENQIPQRVPSGLPVCVGDLPGASCENFNPDWSVIRAVANLILWEPPTSQTPKMIISQRELDHALILWQNGNPIPGTQDLLIDDQTMDTIITLWANGTVIPPSN
jgi:cytochrome c peroxidase